MFNLNPKDLEKAMKRFGVKQEDIPAKEVIIDQGNKKLIIKNPKVSKINAMGQESLQIIGDIEEVTADLFTEEDIKTVAEKANVSENKAKEALKKEGGDLAAAILSLKHNKT